VWRGIYDMTHPARVVAGPVNYLYSDSGAESTSYYLAVDTSAAEAVKYPTGPVMYGRLTIGTVVRLEVTPKLGYVRRRDIVATRTPQPVD
jgi:hypothetical protein